MTYMTKDDLKKMSQDVLVIPFSDETAGALHEFCMTQTEDIDNDKMSELIMSMLYRTDGSDLYHEVFDYLTDKEINLGFDLKVIIPTLTEYIILLSIEEEEDPESQAVFSLMLKNALLSVIKGNAKLANVEGVGKCFGIYNDFLNDYKLYEEGDGNDLIKKVLDNDEKTISFEEEGESDKLKFLVFDAACFRYQKLKKDMEGDGDTDVKKVFNMVDVLVSQTPWIYVEDNISNSLDELFVKLEIQDKYFSLREIVEELQSKSDDDVDNDYNSTSLILRLINKENVGLGLMDDSVKITLKEFAIYLYYEMLTEYFLNNSNNEEE